MDPELQKQLNEMLKALLANAQDAATWAKAEIPLLVQEKIAFGRAWESVLLFIFLLLLLFSVKKMPAWSRKHDTTTDGASWIPTGILFIVGCVGTMIQLHDTLLVWFAPRLYIVEWLIDMVRTAKS